MYQSMSDQALITVTGIDFATFLFLKTDFKYLYENFSPYSKDGTIVELQHYEVVCPGCPRLMSVSDGLGLVLT
jgi:hypothetical protein